jgi:hypothetical protein
MAPKNARDVAGDKLGFFGGAQCPPRGMTVQRWMS